MSTSPPPTAGDGNGDGGGARCLSPTASSSSRMRRDSPNRSARASSGSREFGSSIFSVNKSTSQFKKSFNRKSGSPIDWFPRNKTEPYSKRKIKRLQEKDGMTASLHATLGKANPNGTRMTREKIAVREAARKAMEARKASLVEASWCRVLNSARIQNKEAEDVMEKAKLHATEAFEEAIVKGVMMYDRPDCPNQQYEVESLSNTGDDQLTRSPLPFRQNITALESLDQVLVKHVSYLEREKMEYEERNTPEEGQVNVQNSQPRRDNNATSSDSLDQILVKHISRLEKDKIEHEKKSDTQCTDGAAADLADIFVKRPSKLEQAKLATVAAEQTSTSDFNPVEERRRAREKELRDAWGGGLGNLMKPHLSKMEKDKLRKEILEAKKNNQHIHPLEESSKDDELNVKKDALLRQRVLVNKPETLDQESRSRNLMTRSTRTYMSSNLFGIAFMLIIMTSFTNVYSQDTMLLPTNHEINIALFCRPDRPTTICCENLFAVVESCGGLNCLCSMGNSASMMYTGLNAEELLHLFAQCGGNTAEVETERMDSCYTGHSAPAAIFTASLPQVHDEDGVPKAEHMKQSKFSWKLDLGIGVISGSSLVSFGMAIVALLICKRRRARGGVMIQPPQRTLAIMPPEMNPQASGQHRHQQPTPPNLTAYWANVLANLIVQKLTRQ